MSKPYDDNDQELPLNWSCLDWNCIQVNCDGVHHYLVHA